MTDFENKTPQEILQWALSTYGNRVALACSFGAEDVVLVHMLAQIDPKARIFTLDTGRLHNETYDVIDRIRDKYGVTIEIFFPDAARVEQMVREKGPNLFYYGIENRKLCCNIRKVEPLNRALATLDAWITGLRRDQNVTRAGIPKVAPDPANPRLAKIAPLADWTWDQVWDYIRANKVPYNRLHDQGFPSIGCAPCTRAVRPGEDPRAGRWWWESPEHKECGLHVTRRNV